MILLITSVSLNQMPVSIFLPKRFREKKKNYSCLAISLSKPANNLGIKHIFVEVSLLKFSKERSCALDVLRE